MDSEHPSRRGSLEESASPDGGRQISGRISAVGEPQFDDRRSGWFSILLLVVGFALFATVTRMLVTTYLFVLVVLFLGFIFLQWITRGFFTRAIGGVGRTALFFRMRAPRGEPGTIPIQPFRVMRSDGAEVQCSMTGSLDGGSLSLGDQVVVSGRFDRGKGIYEASSVQNVTTGALTRPRVPVGDRVNRAAMWLLPLAVVWMIYATVRLWSVFR